MHSRKTTSILFFLFLSQMICAQFTGGSEDGYDFSSGQHIVNIYNGGAEDGQSSSRYSNTINIYKGSIADGHSSRTYNHIINIYTGGAEDGYTMDTKFLSFVWTGNVGTGWNVAGNWLNGMIPGINSRVVIPPGATNFPFINAGLMSIGQDPNSGTYLCKQINVRSGAELTLRVNAFLENYGDLEIRGTVYILNTAIDAVQNLGGGKINIRSGGRLEF